MDTPSDCDHDFSVHIDVEMPKHVRYAPKPSADTYCAKCGEKQTLKDKISATIATLRKDAGTS
jgi:hypothetical protein